MPACGGSTQGSYTSSERAARCAAGMPRTEEPFHVPCGELGSQLMHRAARWEASCCMRRWHGEGAETEPYRLKVIGGGNGETRLNDVHTCTSTAAAVHTASEQPGRVP